MDGNTATFLSIIIVVGLFILMILCALVQGIVSAASRHRDLVLIDRVERHKPKAQAGRDTDADWGGSRNLPFGR